MLVAAACRRLFCFPNGGNIAQNGAGCAYGKIYSHHQEVGEKDPALSPTSGIIIHICKKWS
jgi:hypothetical protein